MRKNLISSIFMSSIALLFLAGSASADFVSRDFDGDGRSDYAVFRPSSGTFYYISSATGAFVAVQWGQACDRVIDGDFDGDGRADIAIWRPSTGTWWVRPSQTPTIPLVRTWGNVSFGDIPAPGDRDGDGKTDMIVYRPGAPGNWWVLKSNSNWTTSDPVFAFGTTDDIPLSAAYKDCSCP
ncbi:MAG: VCBS repeat-containing protein [Acidobacteria bacterium]|nr:VCBS repeat-containing protein [Acidobacteriota bacterium]MBK8810551.1 VCBS repeat-containing protein [Acidobacteriota bacterium]